MCHSYYINKQHLHHILFLLILVSINESHMSRWCIVDDILAAVLVLDNVRVAWWEGHIHKFGCLINHHPQ